MSNTKSILSICLLTLSVLSFAQISEVELVSDGVVFPRMNTAQRNVLSPVQGQCIYNTQTKSLECYDGTQWSSNTGSGSSSLIVDGDGDTAIDVEQLTDEDVIRFNTDGTEVMRLDGQTLHFSNNGQSVFVGEHAGAVDDLSNNRNTFVGSLAGQANTAGTQNVAVGHQAMKDNITGSNNVALGQQALQKNNNSNNIAIGFMAARDNNNGNKNIAIGGFSGFTNQSGIKNTMIGYEAGRNTATTTSGSVMIGHQAGMNEVDNNRLIIANDNTPTPLIYGEFDSQKLKTNGSFEATGKIKVGNDTQTPIPGQMRYNSDKNDFEGWNGVQWYSLTRYKQAGEDVSDIDGNRYQTVIIGDQEWFASNLRVTTYNDGVTIPNVPDFSTWLNLTTGAWCYYDNDSNNDLIRGKLYNWHTVDTDKLCPTGWHVPTESEFTELALYLRSESNTTILDAGSKMKEAGTAHWRVPNSLANNDSGFTALPSGIRLDNFSFTALTRSAYYWASTGETQTIARGIVLKYDRKDMGLFIGFKVLGASIRCIKD